MKFEFTLNLSNLIGFAGLAFGLWKFHKSNVEHQDKAAARMASRITVLEEKFDYVYKWFVKNVIERPSINAI